MAEPAVTWNFELVVSKTMESIGRIKQARDRSVSMIHCRPGGAAFTVPMSYDLFEGIEPVKHGIIAYRNAVPKWSGMIWNINEGISANRNGIQCVGWQEILNHRIFRQNVAYPRFGVPQITAGQIVFDDPFGVPGAPDYHPGGLLTQANAQQDTWIKEGSNTDQMKRIVAYERGQTIGEAFTGLSDLEAGFSFDIDPITRELDIVNWDQYEDVSDQAVFGFNWGPNNIADLQRVFDASTLVNRFTALGPFGGGMAEDIPSQQEYQLFEEEVSIGEVTDPNVLLGYAGGEVVLRSKPRVVYQVQPFPHSRGRTPQPFVDYDVGKIVQFSAVKPPRVDIRNQKVRVFGMNVSITNEGNEKLQALQLTPDGSS